MASNPPGQCCTVAFKHDGEPTGQDIKIGNWAAYVATPDPSKAHKETAILYVPDVIGIWQNSKLLVDQYAANGYLCVMIDIFNGDPLPPNFQEIPGFDIMSWVAKGSTGDNPHTTEAIDPIVVETIKWLKEEKGVKKLGSAGYCFGAKYVARHFPEIQVGFFAHPAFVSEEELAGFKAPLSIAAAEVDQIFTTELRHKSEDILIKGGFPYQLNLYSKVVHGFAVKCDLSNKIEKFAKDQAFVQAITWFDNFLL